MAKVEIKQPIVDEIKAKIDGAATVVLVDYRGLTVEQDTKLRKGLREAGCEYKVYKNTLMKRAFEGTDFAQLDDLLDGPSAIAISKEDATAPIRVLNNVAKEAEALEFKGAVVEGTFYDVDGVKALASIPSREELISKLLGSLQSPITNLARVLNQIAEKGGAADAAVEAAPAEEAPAADEAAEQEDAQEETGEEPAAEEQTEVTEQLLFAGQGMRCRYGWGYRTCTVRLLQSVLGKTPLLSGCKKQHGQFTESEEYKIQTDNRSRQECKPEYAAVKAAGQFSMLCCCIK